MPRNISDAFILECLDLGFCRLDWCLAFWYLENPRTCLTLVEYCELVMLLIVATFALGMACGIFLINESYTGLPSLALGVYGAHEIHDYNLTLREL